MHHLPMFHALLLCLVAGTLIVSTLTEPQGGKNTTMTASAATETPTAADYTAYDMAIR